MAREKTDYVRKYSLNYNFFFLTRKIIRKKRTMENNLKTELNFIKIGNCCKTYFNLAVFFKYKEQVRNYSRSSSII